MAIARIEQVQSRVRESAGPQQQIRRRLELHRDNSFERGASVTLADGKRVDLPQGNSEQVATLARHYEGLGADGRQAFEQVSASFAAALGEEVKSNPTAVTGQVSSSFTATTTGAVQGFVAVGGATTESEAYEAIMVGSITYLESDLADFANEVKARTDLGREARTDISELRDAITDWPEDGSTQSFSWTEVKFTQDGGYETVAHRDEPLTKQQATTLMEKLDMQRASISEMTEMMRFDMQQKYERYQQALTVLSNILKEQHNTMMHTINNTKA